MRSKRRWPGVLARCGDSACREVGPLAQRREVVVGLSPGERVGAQARRNSAQTELTGISNSYLIIATTIKGSNATGSFLYKSGTFKKIVLPNSNVPTYAKGVSAGKDLITGSSGFTGFIATCK